jgi:hypothetical protein
VILHGARGKLIHEKTRSKKSRDAVPLRQKEDNLADQMYGCRKEEERR